MSEFIHQSGPEYEEPHELDRNLVVKRLQEYGVPIEPEDLEDLDEDEVYDLILSYTSACDIDMDEILPQVTPVESRNKSGDTPQ